MTNFRECLREDQAGWKRRQSIEAAAQIRRPGPDIRIIIVTSLPDADCLARAKKAGADSMWYKDASEESLMDVTDRTMEGEHIFPDKSPAVTVGSVRNDELTAAENDTETK